MSVNIYFVCINHIEVWSIWLNKTGFLPNCCCVNITVWMYHMNTNKTYREKAKWELHKNDTSYFKQILEATPHKTTAVQLLTFHLKDHPSKMNKTCRTLLLQQEWTHKWCSSMDSYTWTYQCRPTSKNLFISALCGYKM